eukprot:2256447-Pleurochrysis_carterae.AAC.2
MVERPRKRARWCAHPSFDTIGCVDQSAAGDVGGFKLVEARDEVPPTSCERESNGRGERPCLWTQHLHGTRCVQRKQHACTVPTGERSFSAVGVAAAAAPAAAAPDALPRSPL